MLPLVWISSGGPAGDEAVVLVGIGLRGSACPQIGTSPGEGTIPRRTYARAGAWDRGGAAQSIAVRPRWTVSTRMSGAIHTIEGQTLTPKRCEMTR